MSVHVKASAEAANVSSMQGRRTNAQENALKPSKSEVADLLPVYIALSRLPSVPRRRVMWSVRGYWWHLTADGRLAWPYRDLPRPGARLAGGNVVWASRCV